MMKSCGIVRKLDELGRLVIPVETRASMNIVAKDSVEFYVDGELIILKKYDPGCIFCGNAESVIKHKCLNICDECRRELVEEIDSDQAGQ